MWTVEAGSAGHRSAHEGPVREGLHPNADAIAAYVTARGVHGRAAIEAPRLGREFYIRDGETGFARALAMAYRDHNEAAGVHWNAPIAAPVRANPHRRGARQFAEQYGRAPADDRELCGFIARETRARTTAVAGYDLTFSPVKSVSVLWAIAPPLSSRGRSRNATTRRSPTPLPGSKNTPRLPDRAPTASPNSIPPASSAPRSPTAIHAPATPICTPTWRSPTRSPPSMIHGVMRWLALDGQPLHRFTVAASELYNTRLEAHLGRACRCGSPRVPPRDAASGPSAKSSACPPI